jgi:amino acid adenylation domain-containing protein
MNRSTSLSLHHSIDERARKNPDAVAVYSQTEYPSEHKQFTYSELVERANRLAHCLIEAGVEKESLVGLCVQRSPEMIVGLLAILKAGGAYLPLDPAYPSERLAYMLRDSDSRFIVAQKATEQVAQSTSTRAILLDDFSRERYSPESPNVAIAPNQLAYVIYTSGSTGNPKGVMVEHRNLSAFADWTRARFDARQAALVLASSSLSFDVSVFEYCIALASGGALVIVRNVLDLLLKPPSLPISMIVSVPSPVAELVRAGAIPKSVNTIILGGELLSHPLANEIYASTEVEELLNVWGITEDTVATTTHLVPRLSSSDPPIGEPIAGRGVHLLDSELRPVPNGTQGELCCTGSGVARGYLNRPDLSQRSFVPNPFGDSERMYRSGDLAVRAPNGALRFIGRNDQQVKIRGYRVELSEIEAVLTEHPLLAQVAVIAKTTGGSARLALYAVERGPGGVRLEQVEQYLSTRLPKHMIPSTLTLLEAMPLGPTGKIDRKSLENFASERPTMAMPFLEPRDDVERQIAELMASLLGLERVGVHDNFFALGGQSLLAARLIAEVQPLFPAEIHALQERGGERALMYAFWQEPTTEHLAAALQGRTSQIGAPAEEMVRIQRGKEGVPPLFILHGIISQEAFYTWNLAFAFGPDQPVYTLAPHGLNGRPIPLTVEEMAHDHLTKVRSVQPHGPYFLAGYCNGGLVCYEMARMLEASGEAVENLVLIGAPGHNIPYRRLEQAVFLISGLFRMNPAARRTFFLRVKVRLLRLKAALRSLRHGFSPLEEPPYVAPETDPAIKARADEINLCAEGYVPKPYGGPATLIFGKDDYYLKLHRPFQEWALSVRSLRSVRVDGNHHFIENQPNLVVPFFTLGGRQTIEVVKGEVSAKPASRERIGDREKQTS